MKGHLEAVGDSDYRAKVYDKYIKRIIRYHTFIYGLIVLACFYDYCAGYSD